MKKLKQFLNGICCTFTTSASTQLKPDNIELLSNYFNCSQTKIDVHVKKIWNLKSNPREQTFVSMKSFMAENASTNFVNTLYIIPILLVCSNVYILTLLYQVNTTPEQPLINYIHLQVELHNPTVGIN